MVKDIVNLKYIVALGSLAAASMGVNTIPPAENPEIDSTYGRYYDGVQDNLDSGYDPAENPEIDRTEYVVVETNNTPKEVKFEVDNSVAHYEQGPEGVYLKPGQKEPSIKIERQPSGLVIIIDETLKNQGEN